jgi:hypothetical protein
VAVKPDFLKDAAKVTWLTLTCRQRWSREVGDASRGSSRASRKGWFRTFPTPSWT